MLMCPHCGWNYDPAEYVGKPGVRMSPYELVPPHTDQVMQLIDVSAWCPGVEQHPRNPESDRRPLWKDLPKPTE